MGLQSQKKVQLIPIPAVPQQKKKVPFSPVSAPFSAKWVGHRGFQDELHFCRLILQSHRGTEDVLKLFENLPTG